MTTSPYRIQSPLEQSQRDILALQQRVERLEKTIYGNAPPNSQRPLPHPLPAARSPLPARSSPSPARSPPSPHRSSHRHRSRSPSLRGRSPRNRGRIRSRSRSRSPHTISRKRTRAPPERCVHVKNVGSLNHREFRDVEKGLRDIFGKFGDIEDVYIGPNRQWAKITFSLTEDAKTCLRVYQQVDESPNSLYCVAHREPK